MTNKIKQRIEQINRGEVPQGYKKTAVGIVPQEWEETQLSKIFTFKNGLNKEKEAFGKGTPIVNYVDVWKKRGVKASDVQGKVTLSEKEIENYNVKKGDVFFTRTSETKGEIGLSSVMLEDIENAVFSGFVLRARPFNKMIFTPYNQYCYSSNLMRYEVIRKSSITTRALTSGPSLGQVQINLPTITEQQRIADILSKWDSAVELQEKLIKKLELQKKALMQKLLTPKDGWKPILLKKIIKERKTYCIKGQEYTHVTLSKQGVCDKTEQYERDFLVASEDKRYKITHFNDLCYNPANLKFGVICLNKYGDAIFSPIYVTFEIFNKYNSDFIGAVLTDVNFVNKIRRFEEGSIYERQAVKPNDFIKDKVLIPDKETQDKIANIVIAFNRKIALQTQKLEKLKEQQKAMQQLLLTGIVRV